MNSIKIVTITLIISLLCANKTVAFYTLQVFNTIDTLRLSLDDAVRLAQLQSVDATVALNELKSAYWGYRTYRADRLPEIAFNGTVPNYRKSYSSYQLENGSYTFVRNNVLGMNGGISISQGILFTGGKLSLGTSLDFTRQLGGDEYGGESNKFMSVPFAITLEQPVFGVNKYKWDRKIEPVRYKEAKAAYIENVEEVVLSTISYYFNLLLAESNLKICTQNNANANRLYEIARAKRKIGQISESDLMQLNYQALKTKGELTEARSNLNAHMFKLRAFLGLNENAIVKPQIPNIAPLMEINYREVLNKALENNSFAHNILRRQMEADYAVATAKGNRRKIDLYASFGYSGVNNTFKNAYGGLKDNQVVELGVLIPILDWGKRKGQVKVQESNRDVVESKLKQEQMNFNQNVFLLVENFNNQAGQLDISIEADKIAQKRYNTAIETFVIGKISILDLNDARNAKDAAKKKFIEDMYLYWNYYYNIRSISLYDFIENRTLDANFEDLINK
ncbi:MAG: TolC family protein [Bacteroidales bacterium]